MVDITFTVPAMTGGSVTISATVVYGTEHSNERINQVSQLTLDGYRRTWDSGVTMVNSVLKLKNVSKADGKALRSWLINKAKFSLYAFNITTPDDVDLGLGDGVNLTGVKFPGISDASVFQYLPPGIFAINLPVEFVRT